MSDPSGTSPKRLLRSKTNRVFGGVCGGIADYFNIDPTIVRIVFVALAFARGAGALIYFVLWWIIPEDGKEREHEKIGERLREVGEEIRDSAQSMRPDGSKPRSSRFFLAWASIIILAGVMLILRR
jgi:phage shock protein C